MSGDAHRNGGDPSSPGEGGETITRLQATRAKLRRQWSQRTAKTVVSKHYDRAEQYEGALLNEMPKPEPDVVVKQDVAVPEKKKPAQEASHIDQLLRAKRQKARPDAD